MKKIILCTVFLFSCTAQAPVSQAPVYNVTVTDNSQYVIGDNNKAEARPETIARPVAQPDVSAQAKSTGNGFWLFWLGVLVGCAGMVALYIIYLRYFSKKK